MEVDKMVLVKTRQCKKNFGCLKDDQVFCKADSFVNNEILFVKCLNNHDCSYKMKFGFSNVCHCPTRIEIYKIYKK